MLGFFVWNFPAGLNGLHLHSLIYRRLIRWAVGNKSAKALTRRNSMTSPYLWMLCMTAVLFWDNAPVLAALSCCSASRMWRCTGA